VLSASSREASASAASRARLGHSPPAASAIASNVRQLSAARSCSASDTSGSPQPRQVFEGATAAFLRQAFKLVEAVDTITDGVERAICCVIDRLCGPFPEDADRSGDPGTRRSPLHRSGRVIRSHCRRP
jgi:hypothetical protein